MKKLVFILAVISLLGCTNESASKRTLVNQGFTDISVGGYAPFACSDSDTFQTRFVATNPAGKRVKGVVCCGWLKSCTVRF